MTVISSPEFWISFAFLLVVGIFSVPLFRGLNKWTEKQVALIQQEQDEAKEILKKDKKVQKKKYIRVLYKRL